MVWCVLKMFKIVMVFGVKHQHHYVDNTIHHDRWCWCFTPTPFWILNFDPTPHHQLFSFGVEPHQQDPESWWCWCCVAPWATLVETMHTTVYHSRNNEAVWELLLMTTTIFVQFNSSLNILSFSLIEISFNIIALRVSIRKNPQKVQSKILIRKFADFVCPPKWP